MKKILFLITLLGLILTSCSAPSVEEGREEMVLVKKPILFGFMGKGVVMEPVTSGTVWKVYTTDEYRYNIQPVKYEEVFDDIMTDENTPIDITVYALLRVQSGKSPVLHKNYGVNWYNINIKESFRNFIKADVSSFGTYDLTSNREVLDSIRANTMKNLKEYFAQLNSYKEFPVDIMNIIVDRATPNKGLKDEMDRTAIQIQAKRTQTAQKEMEMERRETEIARARADKAYRQEMGLSANEFIQLRALEIQSEQLELIKNKPNVNVDVLLGSAGSLNNWDIKKK